MTRALNFAICYEAMQVMSMSGPGNFPFLAGGLDERLHHQRAQKTQNVFTIWYVVAM